MLDFAATLLSYFLVTLLPLFSVYKLLKLSRVSGTYDAELLAPWLTFYATLSVFTLAEATVLSPLTYLVPFYAWLRLFFHIYLLLPAPQGATYLWTEFINPVLFDHEDDIERYIATAAEEVRAKGGRLAGSIIDWVRVHIMGREHASYVPNTTPQGYASYAQNLWSRWNSAPATAPRAPAARAGGTDLFSAVMSVLQAATVSASSSSSSLPSRSMPGAIPESVIIPPELASATPADRLRYIRQAQQGLSALMQAFAREEARDIAESQHLEAHGSETLSKSKSEAEFDTIEHDEADGEERRMAPKRTGSMTGAGGWMPWSWGAKPDAVAAEKKDEGEDIPNAKSEGKSSGIDL
jgi:receptor expression-enhancing protein 1/2/3/4